MRAQSAADGVAALALGFLGIFGGRPMHLFAQERPSVTRACTTRRRRAILGGRTGTPGRTAGVRVVRALDHGGALLLGVPTGLPGDETTLNRHGSTGMSDGLSQRCRTVPADGVAGAGELLPGTLARLYHGLMPRP